MDSAARVRVARYRDEDPRLVETLQHRAAHVEMEPFGGFAHVLWQLQLNHLDRCVADATEDAERRALARVAAEGHAELTHAKARLCGEGV